jgi:hypothetical protein
MMLVRKTIGFLVVIVLVARQVFLVLVPAHFPRLDCVGHCQVRILYIVYINIICYFFYNV